MSNWTDATNAFCDKIEATIGSSTQGYVPIPEAIDLEEGGELYLRKGYAVDLGPAARTTASVCGPIIAERTYLVTLTRQVNVVATNTEGRKSLKTEMMEDSELIRLAMCDDNNLGGEVIGVDWVSDSGVSEFLESDRDKYYIMGIQYTLTIELR